LDDAADAPRNGLPRPLEVVLALLALALFAPLLLVAALAVAATSRGGVFYRQERVGRDGRRFELLKLRSMRAADDRGPRVTAAGDPRVTPVGRFLRRTKLDELPGLWNVVCGEMSLVGPRPEVEEYVDPDDPLWRRVLRVRPGLTDPTTLRLRREEELLAGLGDGALDFYASTLVPYKLLGYAAYLERRTATSDLAVLARTLLALVTPRRGRTIGREEIEAAVAAAGRPRGSKVAHS
jgi:lipopolysaccharide/colanic/teichoic acid biosynthesis glycosyltransferase